MSSFRLVQKTDALIVEGERFTVKLSKDETIVESVLSELFGPPIALEDQPTDPVVIAS